MSSTCPPFQNTLYSNNVLMCLRLPQEARIFSFGSKTISCGVVSAAGIPSIMSNSIRAATIPRRCVGCSTVVSSGVTMPAVGESVKPVTAISSGTPTSCSKQRLHKAEGQFVAGCENRIGQAAGEDLERRFITRVHAVFRRAQDTAAVRFKTGCALRPQQPLLHTGRDIGPVLVCQKPQAFSAKLQKMARHAIGAFLEIDVAGVKMRGRRGAFRKNKWHMRVYKARRAFRTERGGADNQAVEPLPDCRAQQFVLRAAAVPHR